MTFFRSQFTASKGCVTAVTCYVKEVRISQNRCDMREGRLHLTLLVYFGMRRAEFGD